MGLSDRKKGCMCTHLCHMRVHSRQQAAATRLAHVPRALSESLDTPTCLSKKLASTSPELAGAQPAAPAPSAPRPAGQRLGPRLDGPGTQGVPISHRVAPLPPEQGRLSGAQPAAPAPRAPCPGQVLGPRLGTTGTPGRRHMPRACPACPGGCAQRPQREAREPSCGLHRRGSRSSLSCCSAACPHLAFLLLGCLPVLWAQELRSRVAVP